MGVEVVTLVAWHNADAILASGCLVLLAAALGLSLRIRPASVPAQPAEPAHTGADESYAEELAAIRAGILAEVRAEAAPQPGTDAWWSAEWARVDGVLERARAEFRIRLDAVLGTGMAALVAEEEAVTAEFNRIVASVTEDTDAWPVYRRAEVWG